MNEVRRNVFETISESLSRGQKTALDDYLGISRKTRIELLERADPTSAELVKLAHFFKMDVFDILMAAPEEELPTCIRMFKWDKSNDASDLDVFMPLFKIDQIESESSLSDDKFIGSFKYMELLSFQKGIKQMEHYGFQGELLEAICTKNKQIKKDFIDRSGISSHRFKTLCLNGNLRCSELLALAECLNCYPVFLLTTPSQYSMKLKTLMFVLTRLSDDRIKMISDLFDDMRYKNTPWYGMAYPIAGGVKSVLQQYKDINYV